MAVISEEAIRELAAFRGTSAPVVTCYLDVDGRRHVRAQDYQAELAQLLRTTRGRANGSRAAEQDLQRIEAFVGEGIDRSGIRGLVMISCAAHDLWQVYPLPVSVRSRLVVNDAPALARLESIIQDYERLAVLLVDRQRARLFVFELGQLAERSELVDDLPRHYDSRGHSDSGYDREQHHTDELVNQHLRHAAAAAFELFQEHGFRHLVVGAPAALLHDLEHALHPYLKERLRGRIGLEPSASLDEVRAAALEIEAEIDREREQRLVGQLRDQLGAGGKAAAGLDDVLVALRDRRIERLLVSADFAESGWRCAGCGTMATVGRTCPGCGGEMHQVDDLVEDIVEDALAQGVHVDICVGNADLDVLGRIGAMLRF